MTLIETSITDTSDVGSLLVLSDDEYTGEFSIEFVEHCTVRFWIELMDGQKNELHSILVYIGLVTVILGLFLMVGKLIIRCRKRLNGETVKTRKPLPRQTSRVWRRAVVKEESFHCVVGRAKYLNRANSSISRQTTFASLSSSSPLIDHYRGRSSSQPLLSPISRTCQYKQQYSLPVSMVWNDGDSLLAVSLSDH